MSKFNLWESGQFEQKPDQTVIALQTPADKECRASFDHPCSGCRSEGLIGGDRENLLSELKLSTATSIDVLMYCTSKQATDLNLARQFMLELKDRGANPKVRPLTHEIPVGTNLEAIDSIEISKSPWQEFNRAANIAKDSNVNVIASLRAGKNGDILGTPLNTKDLENDLGKIADYLMETSGVKIAAAYIRANQNAYAESNPTKSLIIVDQGIDPNLVAPIKAYNEFKDNQGITPDILLNPYGQRVNTF
jgi:hypothetical protein